MFVSELWWSTKKTQKSHFSGEKESVLTLQFNYLQNKNHKINQLNNSDLLYDISRVKYMFTMYIYVTGVLDKVPNTIYTKPTKKKKSVEDHHTRWPGPTVSLLCYE